MHIKFAQEDFREEGSIAATAERSTADERKVCSYAVSSSHTSSLAGQWVWREAGLGDYHTSIDCDVWHHTHAHTHTHTHIPTHTRMFAHTCSLTEVVDSRRAVAEVVS